MLGEQESIFRPFNDPTGAPSLRVPPSSLEAERAFLGAVLANNKVLDRVPFLEPMHFADQVNGKIFDAVRVVISGGSIADAVTLKNVFEHQGTLQEMGGTAYLTTLLSAMVGIINAPDYARVVFSTWMRRELIDIADILTSDAYTSPEADPLKIAMETVAMIDQLTAGKGPLAVHQASLGQAMQAAIDTLEKVMNGTASTGISTGFDVLDARLGGLEAGQVYVLGGRPGMGKSALGFQICLNAARKGISTLAVSLEMTARQLGARALSGETGIPLAAIKDGRTSDKDFDRLVVAQKEMGKLPLTIDDDFGQTPRMIQAKARACKRKNGLGLVMVDHLNLTRPEREDARHGPTHCVEVASGMMLQLAKDLNVPVLLLVQLSRGVEGREDRRPTLADLRQSGAIEQDATAVGFLYRQEYYLKTQPERKNDESEENFANRQSAHHGLQQQAKGVADVLWRKVRDGDPADDRIYFDGPTTSFAEVPFG